MLRVTFLLSLALMATAPAGPPLQWSELPALPDPHGFAGPFAGVSGDSLIVAGGANFPDGYPWDNGLKKYHDRIFVLPAPNGTWQESEIRLPSPGGYGASVSLPARDSVLCLGGNDATGATDNVFELVLCEGRVQVRHELPVLPVASTMGCAALLDGVVYFAGGESGGVTHRQCFSLDVSAPKKTWQELPWPDGAPGRILAVAGAAGGQFYLFSGCDLGSAEWDGRTYLTDAWSYHPASRTWKKLAPLPRSVTAAPTPALTGNDGCLLIPGGSNRSFVEEQRARRPATNGNGLNHPGFPTAILAYDPDSNTWSEAGNVPAPAPVTTSSVSWHGRTVIPTGEIKPGIRSPRVLQSQPEPAPAPSPTDPARQSALSSQH